MATAVGARVMASVPSTTAMALTSPTFARLNPTCAAPSAAASEKLGSSGSREASNAAPPVMP